jgi:putative (di)nucleoside polyphosphate hydrolase
MSTNIYRQNAAVIVTDGNGHVLLCERADHPGFLQSVQGGIDPGETPEQAARRELWEEIGVSDDQYEIVASLPDPIRYDWPEDLRERYAAEGLDVARYAGQEQYYFLVRVSPDTKFVLDAHHREFSRVRWGTPQELVSASWKYKIAAATKALTRFGLLEQPIF